MTDVPVLTYDGRKYVRLADIPEQYREAFLASVIGAQCPIIPNESACYYVFDWLNFLRKTGV